MNPSISLEEDTMRHAMNQDFREPVVVLSSWGEPCSSSSALHDLAALEDGNLSPAGKRRLAAHLAECPSCTRLLAALAADAPGLDRTLEPRRAAPPPEAARASRAVPPACHLYLGDAEPLCPRRGPHLVLVLATNPEATTQLALAGECAEIEGALAGACHGDDLRFATRWVTSIAGLLRVLTELKPTVIHFTGQGGERGVMLEDDRGQPRPVAPQALARLIAASPRTRIVVLNACYSAAYAAALRGVVDCVIGMPGAIGDTAARAFATDLYAALGDRRGIGHAVEQAVGLLNARRRTSVQLPICWTSDAVRTTQLTLPLFGAST
jgi:predicted anti-sigma-YlaC factor YlaD